MDPTDCTGLARSGSRGTIADVYPAVRSGPIHRRRKPPTGFRAPRPQCSRGIGACRAAPHIRLPRRRAVTGSPSLAVSRHCPGTNLCPCRDRATAFTCHGLQSLPHDRMDQALPAFLLASAEASAPCNGSTFCARSHPTVATSDISALFRGSSLTHPRTPMRSRSNHTIKDLFGHRCYEGQDFPAGARFPGQSRMARDVRAGVAEPQSHATVPEGHKALAMPVTEPKGWLRRRNAGVRALMRLAHQGPVDRRERVASGACAAPRQRGEQRHRTEKQRKPRRDGDRRNAVHVHRAGHRLHQPSIHTAGL